MAGEMTTLIGANIRTARLERGWKQRELAQKIAEHDPAASNTAVSEWERGVRRPSDRYMPLIAAALDKPIEWFMRRHDKPETALDVLDVFDAKTNGAAPEHDNAILSRLDSIERKVDELLKRQESARERIQMLTPEDAEYALETLRMLEEFRARSGRDIGRRSVQQHRVKDHLRAQAAGDS